jgi:hypothetical protein
MSNVKQQARRRRCPGEEGEHDAEEEAPGSEGWLERCQRYDHPAVFRQEYLVPTVVRNFLEAANHGQRPGSNIAGRVERGKKALGVRMANQPDPDDYADRQEAMSVCQSLELGLNQLHEVACALYIRHKYNQAVVDNFVGDEHVGSERKLSLKEGMATSVKEAHKLSAQTKAAVGVAGGPFNGKRKRRGGGGGFKQPAVKGASLPPGFDKKAATGEQAGRRNDIQCFKCKDQGHFAKDSPNKYGPSPLVSSSPLNGRKSLGWARCGPMKSVVRWSIRNKDRFSP